MQAILLFIPGPQEKVQNVVNKATDFGYALNYKRDLWQKLEFLVVTYLGHFMLSPPFLYRIGLNGLHYKTFSPLHSRKGGESMKCPKYVTTGNSIFCPVAF